MNFRWSKISACLSNTSSVTKNKVKSFISVVYLYVRSRLKRHWRPNQQCCDCNRCIHSTMGARCRRSSIVRVDSCSLEYLYVHCVYIYIYIKFMCTYTYPYLCARPDIAFISTFSSCGLIPILQRYRSLHKRTLKEFQFALQLSIYSDASHVSAEILNCHRTWNQPWNLMRRINSNWIISSRISLTSQTRALFS